MKILVIGNFGRGWDGSICDEEHIAGALENLGHEVTRFQREETVNHWHGMDYDFILFAQWDGYSDEFLQKFSDRGRSLTRIVYWAFDYQWDSQEDWHFKLAKEADLFLSKEMDHKEDYEKMGVNFRWLPQDFAPTLLRAGYDWQTVEYSKIPQRKYEVVFTGSYLPYPDAKERESLLKAVDEKYDLHIFSVTPDQWTEAGFKNSHPAIIDEGLPELYASARVNLSIDWKHAMGYWSDRNAQIMACGGFVLFRHVPLSEGVFKDYIDYFHNEEEMLKKIDFYLHTPYMTEGYEQRGLEFAQRNLMVTNRVKDMLVLVGEIL